MRRLFAGNPQRTDGRLTKNNLLDRTADAVTVAWGVGSDSFGVLYDMYHSITEGEDPATELANAAGFVDNLQIADVPGRGEPGSAGLDCGQRLAVLRAQACRCAANRRRPPATRSRPPPRAAR